LKTLAESKARVDTQTVENTGDSKAASYDAPVEKRSTYFVVREELGFRSI
jgi:hypothetical protein